MLETAPAKAANSGGLLAVSATNTIVEKVWTGWSPSYSNLTIGDGTVVSRFMEAGNLIAARFQWTFGSTSSVDGAGSTISLPATVSSSGYDGATVMGVATFRDAGTGTFTGTVEFQTTTTVEIRVGDVTASHTRLADISSTVPMTWTTGDILAFLVVYEAA